MSVISRSLLATLIAPTCVLAEQPFHEQVTSTSDLSFLTLASEKYQTDHADIQVQDYWMSEKLDGIRAIWNGHQLMTRKGTIIHAPKWFTATLPINKILEGELWHSRDRDGFYHVQRTVLKAQPVEDEWKQIKFMLFDLYEDTLYPQRHQRLIEITSNHTAPHIQVIEQYPITSKDELALFVQQNQQIKAEGVMLRNIKKEYQAGRNDQLIKLKQHQEAEAKVINYKEGQGKYQGMVGAILVKNHQGRVFYLGSGLSDEERLTPPPLGSTVTYRYNGYTNTGLPRFARFLRIRMEE